jgi:hypothetical protein
LTVLTGALLIWLRAGSNWLNYVNTGPGLIFTIGSFTGVMVYFIGMFGVNPHILKLSKIGHEVQAAGGPPTPAQAAALHKLDREMSILSLADFIFVALSLGLMGLARYWVL